MITCIRKQIIKPIALIVGLILNANLWAAASKIDLSTIYSTNVVEHFEVKAKVPTEYTLDGKTELSDSVLEPGVELKHYYSLGGVRLKLHFDESKMNSGQRSSAPQYTWYFEKAAKLCPDYKYTSTDYSECSDIAAGETINEGDSRLASKTTAYWQPKNWTDLTSSKAKLTIEYTSNQDLPKQEIHFKLENRYLGAVEGPSAEPMEGSDVAMLESMLWHMGMSPHAPGSGTRLAEAEKKKMAKVASMVGRFNYTNFSYMANGNPVGLGGPSTKKNLDKASLEKLEQHWVHYQMAYDNASGTLQSALDTAATIFDGGAFTYPNTAGYHQHTGSWAFHSTYTTPIHDAVSQYKSFTRANLLKAIISKESSSQHWYSDKRMKVGQADELGSKGYNQIQNTYSYGARSSQGNLQGDSRCWVVSAYTTSGKSAINHYDPSINAIGVAAFLAGKQGDCGRSFYKAFANYGDNKDEANPHASYTASHSTAGAVVKALKTGNKIEYINGTYQDDSYDLLKKAIGAYNQGQGIFNSTTSWSELILSTQYHANSHNGNTKAEKAVNYAIAVLQSSAHGLELPERQYIWLGDTYPADLKDEAGNPNPKAGKEWCFEYGEKEWKAGGTIIGDDGNSRNKVFSDYHDIAEFDDDKKVLCQ